MRDGLKSTKIKSIELFQTYELIAELGKRFNGFLFAGYKPSRNRGDYPDQVEWDTDLPTVHEIQMLGGQMFELAVADMAEMEEDED